MPPPGAKDNSSTVVILPAVPSAASRGYQSSYVSKYGPSRPSNLEMSASGQSTPVGESQLREITLAAYFAPSNTGQIVRLRWCLHVSQESRMEGLKWYRRSFYVHRHCDDFTFETEPKVYFNPASDRLCLQDGLYMGFHTAQVWRNFDLQFSCFVERGLRSIAINIEPFLDGAGFDILDILTPPMRSLEEILIYRYNDDYGGNLGHLNEVTDYQFEEIEWSYSRDLREIMPYLARTMARINGHLLTTGWKGGRIGCDVSYQGSWDITWLQTGRSRALLR